jgi:hypothetical protein
VQRLLEGYSDPVQAGFIAAKLAWLSGRPSEAIGRLEEIVEKHGSVDNKRWHTPNSLVAHMWIATIARHCGDARRAQRAYEDLLIAAESRNSVNSMVVVIYLYQAEIADTILGRADLAMDRLRAIGEVEPPVNVGANEAAYLRLYQEWAAYEATRLEKGPDEADALLKGSSRKEQASASLAMELLNANGVLWEPRAGFFSGNGEVLLAAALNLVLESRTSPFDKALAQLYLALMSEEAAHALDAGNYYADLFAGESFFAPEGGIHLARLQKNQGRTAEAAKTFAEIKERFPGYAGFVDELSQEPTPGPVPQGADTKPAATASAQPQPKPDQPPAPAE